MNPPSPNPNAWSTLARATLRARGEDPRSTEAPLGFATRVVAHWRDLQRSERFRFWDAWTWRAAFAAAVVCLLSALWQPSAEASSDPFVDLPTLSIPTP